jgi:CDP-6-deoxy-D-xylo-4-hexulose-3-dehydrase
MTTMEGGGVATNSSTMADDLRSMRSHGWSRDRSDAAVWQSGRSDADSKFLFVSTGFNVRPMEIQAAIGILQLESLDSFIDRRKMIVSSVYSKVVDSNLEVVGYQQWLKNPLGHSWMLLPLRVKGPMAREKRAAMMELLRHRGIETRPVLTGNFLAQPAIQRISKQQIPPTSFPRAEAVANESFLVSCHHDLSNDQIEYLGSNLHAVAKETERLVG